MCRLYFHIFIQFRCWEKNDSCAGDARVHLFVLFILIIDAWRPVTVASSPTLHCQHIGLYGGDACFSH